MSTPQTNRQINHRTIKVQGLDIFYREAGPADAPVILLLHGWPASSRMFRNLMPLLADHYRLLAPDYPGFGHSECPSRDQFRYTFENLGIYMDGFLKALRVDRFVLYGHDFGGPVGYRLMIEKPYRMIALIAQNMPCDAEAPTSGGWWSTLAKYWKTGGERERAAASAIYNGNESIRDQYLFGASDPSLVDPDSWLCDIALMNRPGWKDISMDMLHDIPSNAPLLEKVHAFFAAEQPPTLVVSGRNDEIFLQEGQEIFKKRLPEAEMHFVDSGHFALEDKAPEIAKAVRDFLGRIL